MDENTKAKALKDNELDAVSGGFVIDTDEIGAKINRGIGKIMRDIMKKDSQTGPLSAQTGESEDSES